MHSPGKYDITINSRWIKEVNACDRFIVACSLRYYRSSYDHFPAEDFGTPCLQNQICRYDPGLRCTYHCHRNCYGAAVISQKRMEGDGRMNSIKIPVGRSGFADIRRQGYYFIDKSGLIAELLKTDARQVTLITRPRRFGKTLAMSMLYEFFDIRKDSSDLFEGLMVSENKELCRNWMNRYPTLFLSFKDVGGNTFASAFGMLKSMIAEACNHHYYLKDSQSVNENDKKVFLQLADTVDGKPAEEQVKTSISLLIRMLYMHYKKPVILLLDEYDVPMAKASRNQDEKEGYYDSMLEVISPLISTAIKDNRCLKLAVVTGCLRVAKESIFTGANNFVSDTISDTRLNEYFGFTQSEVDRLLADTGQTAHAAEIKEWYDGYHFGDFDVYCPWDVMNYVENLMLKPDAAPQSYWENTSDNSIIRTFLGKTNFDITDKFESLLSGDFIRESIEERLTYDTVHSSEENLWSLLYLTGYLTKKRLNGDAGETLLPGQYALMIPNKEIMDIFRKSVKNWLTDKALHSDRGELFSALWNGDTKKLTNLISDILFNTISYFDYQESFYHAFLVGLVSNAGFVVESNYENGLGRSDIVLKDRRHRRAVVIEAKAADSERLMERECLDALRQIEEKQYAKKIEDSGYRQIVKLGIAFWKKRCMVEKM